MQPPHETDLTASWLHGLLRPYLYTYTGRIAFGLATTAPLRLRRRRLRLRCRNGPLEKIIRRRYPEPMANFVSRHPFAGDTQSMVSCWYTPLLPNAAFPVK